MSGPARHRLIMIELTRAAEVTINSPVSKQIHRRNGSPEDAGMKRRLIQLVVLVMVLLAGYSVAQQPRSDAPRKRVIQPAGSRPSTTLSPAILVGDTLYMSGNIGSDPATGQLAKGGFEAELRQVMTNAQAVLKAAGMDLSDVVAVTAYLADMGDFTRFNEVYHEYFKAEPLPTRSTVAVKDLARGARVELTMTAVRSH